MKKKLVLPFVFMSIIFLGGCGSSDSSDGEDKHSKVTEAKDQDPGKSGKDELTGYKDLQKAAKEMEEKAKKLQEQGGKVEVINFRELKELLPEKLAGMKRSDLSGESTGMMGFKVSSAEADYRDDDGRSLDVSIVDVGGMGMALMGMAAWSTLEIDKEDDHGYERTTTYDGYKVFEKFDTDRQRGEFTAIVADRFLITLTGEQLDMKALKSAFKALDLKNLERMGS